MSKSVLKVEGLYKQYRLGVVNHGTLGEDLSRWWARLRGKPDPTEKISAVNQLSGPAQSKDDKYVWALQDINFEVGEGEIVGIIGKNGAGKSTLLKVLSKTTSPSRGQVKVRGRIASLLEVGTGFHAELTGRENIFLNGAILGMTRHEVRNKLDAIVDFAGVEKYLDTPVKRYSSGMYVRLAFAVAAHLEPDILIVDEVLAVGDADFQKKCLGKMKDVSRDEGRTVLFVSHNLQSVRSLCSRGILLRQGQVLQDGLVHEVINTYMQINTMNRLSQQWASMEEAPGNDDIRVKSIKVIPHLLPSQTNITVRTPVDVEFEFWNLKPGTHVNLSMVLWSVGGECIFNVGSTSVPLDKGLYLSRCVIPGNLLNDGVYSIDVYFVKDLSTVLHLQNEAAVFEVQDEKREGAWYGKWLGAVRPQLNFYIEPAMAHITP